MAERLKRKEIYIYLWLFHAMVWQKPTQHFKVNYPPIKNKFLKINRKKYGKYLIFFFFCVVSNCYVDRDANFENNFPRVVRLSLSIQNTQ